MPNDYPQTTQGSGIKSTRHPAVAAFAAATGKTASEAQQMLQTNREGLTAGKSKQIDRTARGLGIEL